jgi:predicted RNA-binding Zn-ribbon protein involved in translation (DUF1610 family)
MATQGLRIITRIAMSIAAHTEFTCPSCGVLSKAQTRGAVNAQDDPSAKAAILKGNYFNYRCTACGHEIRLLYNCLYIDPNSRQVICLIADDRDDGGKEAIRMAENLAMLKEGGFILRIVRSPNDLREKMLIFDCALDDRIVEIAKGTALSQLPADAFVSEIHFEVIGGLRVLTLLRRDEETTGKMRSTMSRTFRGSMTNLLWSMHRSCRRSGGMCFSVLM